LVAFGTSPTSTLATSSAETACHISVLPRPPAAFSWTEAYASYGWTWMDNLSVGKMNFTRSGKSSVEVRFTPRHSAPISAHAVPSVFPANGPLAIRQSTPVSQASPNGSVKLVFSGKSGAKERAPQRRGLKIGSMRNGSGLTVYAAASAREKKRSRRRSPSSMRSMEVA
jgi:hypothetical protein